jgi:tetratricopeptide (TPR) repeat protein
MAHERTLRGEQYTTSGELREALERGLEVAHSTGEATLRAEPLALLGQAKYRGAEYQAAIDLLQEALPLLEASGRLDQASLFGGTLASAHARLGHFDAAIEWVELATNLARRSGDSTAIIDADLARGEVEAARGNRAQAIDYASRAASEADRVDNKACALVARFIVGEQWLLLGQPDKAIGALAESADLADFCDMTPVLVEFTGVLLDSARQQAGGPAGSPDRIDRALELARQTGDRFHEGVVLRHRARERLRRAGPTEASLADFSTAEAVFRQIEARPELAGTIEEHAAAVRSAGRTSEAEALVGESAALRASMGLVG